MEKKFYTLQEVIFGLRNAYMEHLVLLDQLKKYCEVDEKKIMDFEFVVDHYDENPSLDCLYQKKLSNLAKKIEDFQKRMGTYIYGDNSTRVVSDNNHIFFLNRSFPVCPRINMSEIEKKEFHSQVVALLNSSFSQEMVDNSLIYDLNPSLESIFANINNRGITLSILKDTIVEDSLVLPNGFISYDAKRDELVMLANDNDVELDEQILKYALSIGISAEGLNLYQRKIIDTSEDAFKNVTVDSLITRRLAVLEIKEDNGFILSKKR